MKDYLYKKIPVEDSRLQKVLEEWSRVHQDYMYDISRYREQISPAVACTRSYSLRAPTIDRAKMVHALSTADTLMCHDTELSGKFPEMLEFVEHVGRDVFGGWTCLGRIFVSRMDPEGLITRHSDSGEYFDRLHRFHLVLSSSGSTFFWDSGEVVVQPNELWMLNDSIPHWVKNTGTFRTHLIFDGH